MVLPPGNWDRNVLLPILIAQSRAIANRRKMTKAGEGAIVYGGVTYSSVSYHLTDTALHARSVQNYLYNTQRIIYILKNVYLSGLYPHLNNS